MLTGHPVKEATSCSVGERESRNDSQSAQRSGLGAHRRGLFYSYRSVRANSLRYVAAGHTAAGRIQRMKAASGWKALGP